MTPERFAPVTLEHASKEARPLLAATEKQFGFVPSPVARAAGSAPLLQHLLAGFGAFDRAGLTPLEREVVALTVAFANECHYCMALHSALLAAQPENAALLAALREGRPLADARLEAVRLLTLDLLAGRGQVSDARWRALEAAGVDEQTALGVLLGVGVYVLSTFANRMTGATVDGPFEAFRWEKPRSA